MKLVIYDENWSRYASLFQRGLNGPWEIAARANDPARLVREIEDADALVSLIFPPEARAVLVQNDG